MNSFDRIRLLKCAPLIKDSLVPKYVVTTLLAEDVLDEDDFKDVLSAKGREKQVQKLLDILPEKGSQAFRKFVRVLEEDYDWLADEISCMEVTDDEVESFFASRGNGRKLRAEVDEPIFTQREEERGIDVQDSVPLNRRASQQVQAPVQRSSGVSKEITYDMLTVLRRNSRVVRNWCALAHRLGLSTQVTSINMKINMRGENVDLAIVYLMEEWKGIKPNDYNLEKLVGLLRDEQFNDVAEAIDDVKVDKEAPPGH